MSTQPLQSFEGEITDDAQIRETHSTDTSLFRVHPHSVAFPKHTSDIRELVRYATQDPSVSLTVRSGGTCMSGGPLSQSIVVNMQKHMNRIRKVTKTHATVEPGTLYKDLEKETLKHNALLPTYPASREICTVGGMVHNNSGGEKTLTYGKTEDYVMSMKAVLHDGNEYVLEALSKNELDRKMKQQDAEGHIYRSMYELISKHHDLIRQSKPDVSKNSTGYALWDVWDGTTFDLTRLFTGSQGTLGITTEITFKLITPKPHKQMLVIFLHDLTDLAHVIKRVHAYKPESFESYDDNTLKLAMKFIPTMAKQMGVKNVFSLFAKFIPEAKLIITKGIPRLILIAEFTGHDHKEIQARTQAAQQSIAHYPLETRLVQSEKEGEKYWNIRRESFNLLRNKIKGKRTAPFIDDVIVRPSTLPEFLPRLNDILRQYDIEYTIAGHVGDGNFHIIPLMNMADEAQRNIIPELSQKVYELVFSFNGSMSAEHNDGLIRSPFLETMYGKDMYALFEETKHIFDPHNIFNPGKKVGSSMEYALEHMVRE